MKVDKYKKKHKVTLLEPSEVAYWKYTSKYGSIGIYLPPGTDLTVERANWLLDQAKAKLLDE